MPCAHGIMLIIWRKNYHIKYRQRSRTRKSRPNFTNWRFETAVYICMRFILNIISMWHWKYTSFSFIHEFGGQESIKKVEINTHMHMEDSSIELSSQNMFQLDIEVSIFFFFHYFSIHIYYSCLFQRFLSELLKSAFVTFLNVNLINNERSHEQFNISMLWSITNPCWTRFSLHVCNTMDFWFKLIHILYTRLYF